MTALPPPIAAAVQKASATYHIPVNVLDAVIHQESGGNQGAVSRAGAIGLMQLMPGTAAGLGVNPHDPEQNIMGGAKYLRAQLDTFHSLPLALAAYNAGPHAVERAGGIPDMPETQRYVSDVMALAGVKGGSVAVPTAAGVTSTASTPAAVDLSQVAEQNLQQMASGRFDPLGQLENLTAAYTAQESPTPAPSTAPAPTAGAVASKPFKVGDPVADGTSVGGEHPTSGLAGYPARDYFAPSGSPVVAPISGKVIKLSGHPPSEGPVEGPHGPLGWSVYIQGSDGHTYYLTHMGSRTVRVGQTLKAGAVIGTVADYSKYGTPSHIHMGVH